MNFFISTTSLVTAYLLIGCHSDLIIQPQESEISKPVGSSILLTCSSHTASNLKWVDKNANAVNETDGSSRLAVETVDPKTIKLHILNIIVPDAGTYYCIGNISGRIEKKSIKLRVFKDITFDVAPAKQHLVINTTSTLSCIVSGDPMPTVEWKFMDRRLQYGAKYEKVAEGLKVKNVDEGDKGTYTCTAEVSQLGKFELRTINVEIYAPPKILNWFTKVEALVGQSITFVCNAKGFPEPIFSFYKEITNADNTTLYAAINSNNSPNIKIENNKMTINSLSKHDETCYKCKAHNDAGRDHSDDAFLKILIPAEITHFSSISVRSGGNATMECLTDGDPDNDVSIYFNGALKWRYTLNSRFDGLRSRFTIPKKNVFLMSIVNIQPEDAGIYSCVAQNRVGKDVKNATLIVELIVNNSDAPFIVRSSTPNEAYVWPDVTKNITCHFKSQPEPTAIWKQHKSGDVIKNNASFTVFVGHNYTSLQIHVRENDQAWIYESYQCAVSNIFGNDSFVIHLKRATIPDSPSVRLLRAQSTDIWLAVQPSEETGGMPIIGYIVQNQDKTYEYGLENELRVSNLQPNTMHLLTIKSKNDVGIGAPTYFRAQTSGINPPHIQLYNQDQINARSRDYRIFWTVNTTGGLPITEYEFLYKKAPQNTKSNEWNNEYQFNFNHDANLDADDQNSWIQIKVKADTQNTVNDFLITDLTPHTLYVLKMRAKNAISWSDYTELIEFQTTETSFLEYDSKDKIPTAYYAIIILLVVIFILVTIATIDVAFCLCCDKGLTRLIFMRYCKLRRNNSNEKQCLQMKNINGNGSHSKSSETSSNNGHNHKSKKHSHKSCKKKRPDPDLTDPTSIFRSTSRNVTALN
ncbi:hypothetical protein HELRODRAFT_189835 [Helobdella robusta]|uniref:Uncharacterized protein n=1 Tax=Helobdella robusta TaxID=6412 RepID=T1FRE6_HELRO|nr:hypothetical protein HELRODRAFT_189835 [Helobdella robusta]ESN90329.1 hypothetical protein HELRODRAFT_189835 [Helobdella robusta]